MFDREKLKDVLAAYKRDIIAGNWWENEKFKWEAVRWFQDNWDVNAPDFAEMLERSLDKTYSLLASANHFPKGVIVFYAKSDPEKVRAMFIDLFDESRDVYERMNAFKQESAALHAKFDGNANTNHFQDEHAVSIYLWLSFPDKYYIYKYSEAKKAAEVLGSDHKIKKGAFADNIRNFLELNDEISAALKDDSELIELVKSQMTDACYTDPELKTLTTDIGFYISRQYSKPNGPPVGPEKVKYWPSLEEYDPEITKEKWKKYIEEVELPSHKGCMKMLKALMELGGEASCKKLSVVYGGNPSKYIGYAVNIGKRAKKYFDLSPCMDGDVERYFPVPFLGGTVNEGGTDYYSYKIRPELFAALSEIDLSGIDPYVQEAVNPIAGRSDKTDKYTKEDFLKDVYMSEEQYESLVSLLKNKSNIILQGAPGVGKTFAAKRLAWSLMGEKDENRIEFVQFHQNYSYEDFMMGYKPTETGFELKYGIFYQFCLLAANRPEKDFFFIIDEINRGNMSKVFGELLMLIEKDYRGTKTTLAYNGMPFSVPKNLYIIGMMNTADRSLALIDYALRRRFSFFTIDPGFDSQGFKEYQASLNNEKLNMIVDEVKKLNKAIEADRSLGRGFCIGHSYFCGHKPEDGDGWLKEIVDYDLIPMLSEYWFDDTDKVDKWADSLNGVLNG